MLSLANSLSGSTTESTASMAAARGGGDLAGLLPSAWSLAGDDDEVAEVVCGFARRDLP
jgi:hypothetical protein